MIFLCSQATSWNSSCRQNNLFVPQAAVSLYKSRMTELEPMQQVDRTYVRHQGRRLSYFSGCDYFRLASHPAVVKAVQEGLKEFGLNVAASRLTTGNHRIYQALENELADFFDAEAALLLPNGYATSLAVAQALAGDYSHALIDERSHLALLDAAQMLECPVLKFKHRDTQDFARTIARCGRGARPVALTDGMFSHDGSIAPLKAYLKSLPRDGAIIVDDAHGAGVLGRTGKGTPEIEAAPRKRVIQCITLSKAFGVYGGAVLGTRTLREKMITRSRMFVGSTPLPLPLANAALTAVRTLKSDHQLHRRLACNINYVKTTLRRGGFNLPTTPSPIIPLHLSNQQEIAALKRRLLNARIYPPFLKYPGSPVNGYFRFVLSSEHTRMQLDNLLDVLMWHR
jgi:7-keto-8-aminopelargonate synthetase-like enzyme